MDICALGATDFSQDGTLQSADNIFVAGANNNYGDYKPFRRAIRLDRAYTIEPVIARSIEICFEPIIHGAASTEAPKPRNKSQQRLFVESARELGVDEDGATFEEKLKQIAKAKPVSETGEKKPSSC